MKCKYCSNDFKNISSLNNHQQTARYCLKIQNQNDTGKFKCEYCDLSFTTKNQKLKHEERTCKNVDKYKIKILEKEIKNILKEKEELTKQIVEKDKENVVLEEKLKDANGKIEIYKSLHQDSKNCVQEIARQPKQQTNTTTTSNNTSNKVINNLAVFDMKAEGKLAEEKVESKFSKSHYLDGQQGVAKFCVDHLLVKDAKGKDKMICSDVSRGIFKRKNEEGEIVKDYKATEFTNLIYAPVLKKSNKYHKEIWDNYFAAVDGDSAARLMAATFNTGFSNTAIKEIKNLPTNNSKFIMEIAKYTTS